MNMRYLFRTYSKQSNGTNSETIFAPAAASKHAGDLRNYEPPQISQQALGPQLKAALKGDKTLSECPFSFWTPSLLFALQWALFKRQHSEQDIRICCLDTQTATTPAGRPVSFVPASTLITRLQVGIPSSTGEPREYAGESISLDCIVPGAGTRIATVDSLLQKDLYDICPVLAEANQVRKHGPKMYRVLADLREYFPVSTAPLDEATISTAARLALAFAPVQGGRCDALSTFLLAGFLALCRRNSQDRALTESLARFANSAAPASIARLVATELEASSNLPEVSEHLRLYKICGAKAAEIVCSTALLSGCISPAKIGKKKLVWQEWHERKRAEWQASRANEGRVARKKRAPKSQGGSKRSTNRVQKRSRRPRNRKN